jgi:multisubunit Na+/H+ antiporter MnhC subunit
LRNLIVVGLAWLLVLVVFGVPVEEEQQEPEMEELQEEER